MLYSHQGFNAMSNRVWVCETQNRRTKRWHVWFAHRNRAWVFQSMRVGRHDHPNDKFRTIAYTPQNGTEAK